MFVKLESISSNEKTSYFTMLDREHGVRVVVTIDASEQYADTLANKMLLGLNLFDPSGTYKTECGYDVRKLSVTINNELRILVDGEFKGAEGFWIPAVWDTSGKHSINPELNLVQIDEIG
jgi:hypothetical protein